MIDIKSLKAMSNLKHFQKGQVIVEDGETMCDEMYILLRGTADVYKNYQEPGEIKIATIATGSFFGEMSLFLNKERTATVVSYEDVIVLAINHENALDFFEKQPEATYSLIKTLCLRLDSTNTEYKKLYNELHPEAGSVEEADCPSMSGLFPDGHKMYHRTVNMSKVRSLLEKSYTCPLCGTAFTALTDTVSCKEPTYHFQRPGKGMNDFYFEVIFCTNCWYSMFAETFNDADNKKDRLEEDVNYQKFKDNLRSHKSELTAMLENKNGILGVFIKYYLALKYAPLIFENYESIAARLWTRLSWLYYDCKDENLEIYAIRQAQKAYISAIGKREFAKDQLPYAYFAIGELNFKIGDFKTAKTYFDRVEESAASSDLKQKATERLDDVQQRKKEGDSRK